MFSVVKRSDTLCGSVRSVACHTFWWFVSFFISAELIDISHATWTSPIHLNSLTEVAPYYCLSLRCGRLVKLVTIASLAMRISSSPPSPCHFMVLSTFHAIPRRFFCLCPQWINGPENKMLRSSQIVREQFSTFIYSLRGKLRGQHSFQDSHVRRKNYRYPKSVAYRGVTQRWMYWPGTLKTIWVVFQKVWIGRTWKTSPPWCSYSSLLYVFRLLTVGLWSAERLFFSVQDSLDSQRVNLRYWLNRCSKAPETTVPWGNTRGHCSYTLTFWTWLQ